MTQEMWWLKLRSIISKVLRIRENVACSGNFQPFIIAKSEEESENKALKVKNQKMKGHSVGHSEEGEFPPGVDRSP